MRTIYKYPIEVTDNQEILMPIGAEILCVQVQSHKPFIWAMVEIGNTEVSFNITTKGTGHNISDADNLSYIGTYQLNDGQLVFHVFRDI